MTNSPQPISQSHSRSTFGRSWRSRFERATKLVGAGALVAGVLVGGASASDAGQVIYAPLVNPSANIAPNPNFLSSGACTGEPGNWTCANPCVSATMSWTGNETNLACANYVMEAINNARATLGENQISLPSNWISLTPDEQLFVIADIERTSAGYPAYLGLNDILSSEAAIAAAKSEDPSLAPGFAVGNNPWGVSGFDGAWAGTANVLFADYMWMYDDGWAGAGTTSNIACTSATAWGCWAHRDELLGSSTSYQDGVGLGCTTCEMGAAYASVPSGGSLVDLIELPEGVPPAMTFTWASELPYFAAGANPPATPPLGTGLNLPSALKGKVHFTKARFGTAGLALNWSISAGSTYVVAVEVFQAPGCRFGAHTHTAITGGAINGVAAVPVRGWFVRGRYYSVRLVVGESSGLAKGGCLNLGVFL